VGILHSLTGTMAHSESPVVDAALLAIDQVNEAGGVLGRPVEAIVADGRSDSDVFAREARRLIEQDEVCTVFGCWTSASRKTVVPIFEELDHLLVYPVQYEGIEESPNVIYTGAAPNQQIIPAVKWAYAFDNRRRFFLVGSDYVFPRVAHEIIKDQLQELGAELAGEAYLPLGSSDVQAVVDEIVAAQPDVILNAINGDSNIAFFSALREAGITPEQVPTISFSIEEEELRQLDAAMMAGDYAAWNYFQSVESPENKQFVSAFHDKYGPQRVVTDPMEAAYFGVKLWAQAVNEAQSIERSEVRRAMRNQRMRAPEGDVRIDSATQHTFKTPRIGRVQEDGQFEIVWTAAKPEPPAPYPPTRTSEQWRGLLHDLYTGWGNQWAAPSSQ
jgi:urea transport system substrate-binding protein